jgi:hypothetical protein
MKNDEDSFAEKKTGEEEIIDFEFDELSEGAGDAEMTELDEKEIIELVDVVEMGEAPASPDSATAEIERLLDEEGTLEEVEVEEASDENFEPVSETEDVTNADLLGSVEEDEFELLESEETSAISEKGGQASLEEQTEDLTLDLDSALETITPLEKEVSSQEWGEPEAPEPTDAGETELEELKPIAEEQKAPLEPEAPELEDAEEAELEELTPVPGDERASLETGIGGATLKLPAEDLSAIPGPGQENLGMDVGGEVSFGAVAGISEERMEEIIFQAVKEAVQDSLETVVERAARETMTEVAERLITDAIGALKESLASESD